MDINHSRLLKFVVNKPKMAETEVKFRYDYKDPENVNSRVPGEQKLRESIETSELAVAKSYLTTGNKVESPGDFVLTPVVTVTKSEEIKNGVFVTIRPPTYPEIQSDVLHNPEAIRRMGDQNEEEKKRTRIPKLRFRQAVKNMKRERRASCEAENGVSKVPNPSYQRRSSIPRLKKFASVDNDKTEKHTITPLDDEFEKIYDEVATDSINIDESILNTKVDDPVTIEHSFEEIIHAYDENKVQPITVDKTKHTKIPMLKRRSEHEKEVSKVLGKNESIPSPERLKVQDVINKYSKLRDEGSNSKHSKSIQTGILKISDENNIRDDDKKVSKTNYEDEIPIHNIKVVNISNQPIHSELITYDTEVNIKNNNNNDIVSNNTIEIIEEKAPIYNETVELLPAKEVSVIEIINAKENVPTEPVKVATVEELNLITQNILNNSEYSIQYSVKTESNAIPINSNIDIDVSNSGENKKDNDLDEVKEEIIIEQVNFDNNKVDTEDEMPQIKGKVSKMIRQLSSNPEYKEDVKIPSEELPKTKSVLSKIAMFERSEPVTSIARPREYKSTIKSIYPFTEEEKYMPKVVNGALKTANKTDPTWNENKKHKMTYEGISYEENNVIHSITTREVDAPTTVDIIESPPIENKVIIKNESYLKTNKVVIPKDTEEIEIKPIEPYRIEYAQPINTVESVPYDFEPKINQIRILNNNQDVVYLNHKTERPEVNDRILYKSQGDLNSNKIEPSVYDNKVYNRDVDSEQLKEDFRRLRSTSEDHRSQKVKSFADIDLGESVKGKVHNLIVRINSSEKLDVEKREVISAKERPRKKSVSEKIALFESKLSIATTPSTTRLHTAKAQKPLFTASELREEDIKAKIAELEAARVKYGWTDGSKSIVLANGVEMPQIGLGTAMLDPKLTVHIVSAAIDMGYRAIDTAYLYGNEKQVGEGIRRKIEDGTVRREDLFITSKLWSTFHRTDLVEGACRRSLEAMGLDYFDLYLVHSPMSFKEGPDPLPKIANVLQYSSHDYLDAWFGMERLVSRRLATSIGVSNFNSQQLQRLVDKARVKPVINQVEGHPYLSQHKLDVFCAERNVKLTCYGVLGSRGTPEEQRGANNTVLEDPLVQVMAAGLGITPAQLLIRYHLDQGRTVVVKASTPARLHDNLQAVNCCLTEGQVDALAALNRNKRTYTFKGMGDTHKNYPFKAHF